MFKCKKLKATRYLYFLCFTHIKYVHVFIDTVRRILKLIESMFYMYSRWASSTYLLKSFVVTRFWKNIEFLSMTFKNLLVISLSAL
jgi:hypothetical protein